MEITGKALTHKGKETKYYVSVCDENGKMGLIECTKKEFEDKKRDYKRISSVGIAD